QHADQYRRLFSRYGLDALVQLPVEPVHCYHVYNQFTVRVAERDRLREFLKQDGIPTEVYYPQPLHLQPPFAYLGHQFGHFPHARADRRELLSLPIYPELSAEQQEKVVTAIARFCNKEGALSSAHSESVGFDGIAVKMDQ